MQNAAPKGSGAVLLGGERSVPNKNRPTLQANAAMALRLRALLWGCWWLGGARP
jgi:hypothetical protein